MDLSGLARYETSIASLRKNEGPSEFSKPVVGTKTGRSDLGRLSVMDMESGTTDEDNDQQRTSAGSASIHVALVDSAGSSEENSSETTELDNMPRWKIRAIFMKHVTSKFLYFLQKQKYHRDEIVKDSKWKSEISAESRCKKALKYASRGGIVGEGSGTPEN